MPINSVDGVVVETPIQDKDQFERTGSIRDDSFEVIDRDRSRKIKFECNGSGGPASVTFKVPEDLGDDVVVTLPSADTTLSAGSVSSVTASSPLSSTGGATPDISLGTVPVAKGGTNITSYTTGDVIYASGSGTLSKLAIGEEGQFLKTSSGSPAWSDLVMRDEISLMEDFLCINTAAMGLIYSASGGSVAYSDATAAVPSNAHPGIWKRTLASSSGYSTLTPSNNAFFTPMGGGKCVSEWMVYLSNLSDGTDTFSLRAGLGNQTSNADFTDGVYFYYTHSNNSGQWSARCVNNSSATQLDSNVSVAAATWYRLTAVVNSAGTSAEFFVNGTSIGTISTNIPTAYPRIVGPVIQDVRTAGTATRYLITDYCLFHKKVSR